MTITDDQIRDALEHRIRAAGLDDPAAISSAPRPDLHLATPAGTDPTRSRRRVLAVAAALVAAGGTAAVLANRPPDHGRLRTTPTASTTTTTSVRLQLPPPWPRLETFPELALPKGDPNESDEELLARLPELDAQTRAQFEETGRENIRDDVTGELLSVDAYDHGRQVTEAARWRTEHFGDPGPGPLTPEDLFAQDPVLIFTDGSVRLVYRSDLCAMGAVVRRSHWCTPPAADDGTSATTSPTTSPRSQPTDPPGGS